MILSVKKLTKAEREAELAELAVGGDDDALGTLLMQYYPLMFRMSLGYAQRSNRFEPEDLANECFAVLMKRRLKAFDKTKASFCTWVHYQIRSVIGRTVIETHSVGKDKLNKALVFSQSENVDGFGLETMLAGKQEDICLAASIEQLTCRLEPRRAMVLRMISDGHTLEEVAVSMGITRQRVQQLKISAIEELKEVYAS